MRSCGRWSMARSPHRTAPRTDNDEWRVSLQKRGDALSPRAAEEALHTSPQVARGHREHGEQDPDDDDRDPQQHQRRQQRKDQRRHKTEREQDGCDGEGAGLLHVDAADAVLALFDPDEHALETAALLLRARRYDFRLDAWPLHTGTVIVGAIIVAHEGNMGWFRGRSNLRRNATREAVDFKSSFRARR